MQIIKRVASRAVCLNPQRQILLIKIKNPDGDWEGWITPGGGANPEESLETVLTRELLEEVGYSAPFIGPKIWTRFHRFPWRGRIIEQSEHYFYQLTPSFDPIAHLNPDHQELEEQLEHRWWTLEEIEASNENFAPRNLGILLKNLLEHGPPETPLDCGI